VGLILFVLRAPDNEPDPKWRWLERMLPLIGAVLALFMLFTYGNLTGYRTETGTALPSLSDLSWPSAPSLFCSNARGGNRRRTTSMIGLREAFKAQLAAPSR
jgi:hypothetical protein